MDVSPYDITSKLYDIDGGKSFSRSAGECGDYEYIVFFDAPDAADSYLLSSSVNDSGTMTFSVGGETVTTAAEGQRVDITLSEPGSGENWDVRSDDVSPITQDDATHFHFTMPAKNVMVYAEKNATLTEYYAITDNSTHGHVNASGGYWAGYFACGETATLTVVPDAGYEYVDGTLSATNRVTNEAIALTGQEDGTWTFTMPAANVDVAATFTAIGYFVQFDKNHADATGTMHYQTIAIGDSQVLMANAFTRMGYTFAGWSTTPGGSVVYADRALVSNLAARGETVTLYAQWTENGTPDTPDTPVIPVTPETPDTPVIPVTPETPDTPVTPVTTVTSVTLTNGAVNMPVIGTSSLTIPDGTTSFKVYDDGGASSNYSAGCDGYLLLTAPGGFKLQVTGTADTNTAAGGQNALTIFDGGTTDDTKALDWFRSRRKWAGFGTGSVVNNIGTVSSTGRQLLIYFHTTSGFTLGNDVLTYPDKGLDLTVTVVESADPNDHFTDNGDGTYTIKSAEGWGQFCDLLANNTKGYFDSKTIYLDASIGSAQEPITRMAGSDGHEFTGTFNGQGYTLTVSYGSSDSRISEPYAAPFRYVDGGTIQNLRVSGSIYTSAKYAAGIIADQYGAVTISNCRSSVTINSSVSGDGTHGGFVAVNHSGDSNSLNIEGCLFDGKRAPPSPATMWTPTTATTQRF